MPVGAGLPSTATVLFNTLITGLSAQINTEPKNANNDDTHEALEACQKKYN